MNEELREYRDRLVDTQKRINENYDKLVVALSGGALALSITFLKDIVQFENVIYPKFLIFSWIFFVISLAVILGEMLLGMEAHDKAVKQVNDGTIYNGKVGGMFSFWTLFLRRSASVSLILGLLLLSIFAYLNIGEGNVREKTAQTESTAAST